LAAAFATCWPRLSWFVPIEHDRRLLHNGDLEHGVLR
jgi:hypothetical protein